MKYSLKKEQLFDIRDLKFHNFMLKKKLRDFRDSLKPQKQCTSILSFCPKL